MSRLAALHQALDAVQLSFSMPANKWPPGSLVEHHGERYRVTGIRYGGLHTTVELEHDPTHGEPAGWAWVHHHHKLKQWIEPSKNPFMQSTDGKP